MECVPLEAGRVRMDRNCVLAVVVGGAVGTKEMKDWAIANGESRRAEQILDQGDFKIPAR